MNPWLLVAIGSASGGVLRYALARLLPTTSGQWPVSTLLANLLGCFAIGALAAALATRAPADSEGLRLFWMTGVLGGFTTWSAFALESSIFLGGGLALRGMLYVLVTLVGCIGAAFAGRALLDMVKG